jgi:predicted GNAT superfamily acetyltransferase
MSTDVHQRQVLGHDGGPDSDVVVRAVQVTHEFLECEQLFRQGFGFSERDAVPAREIFTLSLNGGIPLGAFVGSELVGFSYSFAGFDGTRPYLYSNGLVVKREYQGRRIGLLLKREQRRLALRHGYALIRWSCRPLASRLLYLYLNALGARIVGYCPALYEAFIPETRSDEAIIDWPLGSSDDDRPQRASSAPSVVLTETQRGEHGARAFSSWHPERIQDAGCLVEIPWDFDELRRHSPEAAVTWQLGARDAMQALLEGGFVGVRVAPDAVRSRSFVEFRRIAAPDDR